VLSWLEAGEGVDYGLRFPAKVSPGSILLMYIVVPPRAEQVLLSSDASKALRVTL